MSEKNEEVVQEIKARWSEGRCVDVSFETVKLAAVDIQVLCRIIHDHEAMIGVLVGALETLKWLIDMQADLKRRASQQDTNAYDKAVMALSHPLVQEYLKKEKV